MKNINMKKSVLTLFAGGLLAVASSCTSDFDKINTNPLLPTDVMLGQDGVLNGGFLPTLQFAPIAT